MVREGVVIPAFRRVEFLHLCLEYVLGADEPPPEIVVVLDDHDDLDPSPEVVSYLEGRGSSGDVEVLRLSKHGYPGLSYCAMNSIMYGLVCGWDYTYYIEDDIMIAKDFFHWHREVRKHGDWFCSIGCQNHCETEIDDESDPLKFYSTSADYSALGVCFPAWAVQEIAFHATSEFWGDYKNYVVANFPNSRVLPQYYQQAGLIRRILEFGEGWESVFPCAPRGFHLGWCGQNCTGKPIPKGSFSERVDFVRSVMFDKEALNGLATKYKFMNPVNLDGGRRGPLTHHKHYP